MKISHMQEELEAIRRERGDIDVLVYKNKGVGDCPKTSWVHCSVRLGEIVGSGGTRVPVVKIERLDP